MGDGMDTPETVMTSRAPTVPINFIFNKGPSIYYVIQDGGGGVFPIYYNIT